MKAKRTVVFITAMLLLLSAIASTTFADVSQGVYNGYNYTARGDRSGSTSSCSLQYGTTASLKVKAQCKINYKLNSSDSKYQTRIAGYSVSKNNTTYVSAAQSAQQLLQNVGINAEIAYYVDCEYWYYIGGALVDNIAV
ncbi:MAG: hypothetical protein Q4C01_06575 [Clostridia bacterium]|nr:hypothetical protein [Clostridia bacterium]